MPVVICPHCDERQTVSRDLAGLAAKCSGCGEGMQIPLAPPRLLKPPSSPAVVADTDLSGTDLRKTVLLLGGLIVGVLVVLGVLLYAVSPSKKESPSTAPTAPTAPKAATPVERDPGWSKSPPEREDSRAGWTALSILAMGYVGVVVITLLFIVYVVAVVAAGVALTRDAAARGLPPLPWAAAYFLFHAVGPALGAVVATPLMVFLPPLGLMAGAVLSLVGGWYGGLMYLAVRRPGKKLPCPRCRNARLKYLVTCPHCGQTDAPG